MNYCDIPTIDYRILAYFKSHEHTSIEDASLSMPDIESIDLRIQELTSEYLCEDFEPCVDAHHVTSHRLLGTFCITPLGRKILQDHEEAKKQRKKEIWLVNAKIPIIVSFITTVLLNWLLPLLPEIIKWFANFL